MSTVLPRLIVKQVEPYGRNSSDRFDLNRVTFVNPVTDTSYVLFQRIGDKGLGSCKFIVGHHWKGLRLYIEANARIQIDNECVGTFTRRIALHRCGTAGNTAVYYSDHSARMVYITKVGVKGNYEVAELDLKIPNAVIQKFSDLKSKEQIFEDYGIYDFE